MLFLTHLFNLICLSPGVLGDIKLMHIKTPVVSVYLLMHVKLWHKTADVFCISSNVRLSDKKDIHF